MATLHSPTYPSLVLSDLGVRFVDGELVTDDPRVLARAHRLAHLGVTIEHDETETEAAPEVPAGTPLSAEEAAEVARREAAPEVSPTPAAPASPKGNATREEWAAHAAELGVEVPEGAGQREIRALVATATQAHD